jgi:hypothetical protein
MTVERCQPSNQSKASSKPSNNTLPTVAININTKDSSTSYQLASGTKD